MASCVYIINMIKCFPRMKLLNCHTTPGYYPHGFKMLIRESEGNGPHPNLDQPGCFKHRLSLCQMVPKPPTTAAVIQQRRGDLLTCMDNVLSDFSFYKGGLRSST